MLEIMLDEKLHDAAWWNDFEKVKILIKMGADPHINNEWVLRRASRNGHLEVVKYLISKGADIHAWYDAPIRSAKRYGHKEIITLLTNLTLKEKRLKELDKM